MPRPTAGGFAAIFLLSALLSAASASSLAHGQDAEAAPRSRIERPPEGSWRRGALPVPGWLVYASGAALACAAGGALVWRAKR